MSLWDVYLPANINACVEVSMHVKRTLKDLNMHHVCLYCESTHQHAYTNLIVRGQPNISQFIVSDLMRLGIKFSSLKPNGGNNIRLWLFLYSLLLFFYVSII